MTKTHSCRPQHRWRDTPVLFMFWLVAGAIDHGLGTIWEQYRPNTRVNGGVGPTRKQDEQTR
jgi:hypothetical protein